MRCRRSCNDTVAADQKSLDLTQTLYDTGIDDYISVVEAKTTLESAQAAATNLGVARAQYEHAIAVLVGKVATDFSIPVTPLLRAPPAIPVGSPRNYWNAGRTWRPRNGHSRKRMQSLAWATEHFFRT